MSHGRPVTKGRAKGSPEVYSTSQESVTLEDVEDTLEHCGRDHSKDKKKKEMSEAKFVDVLKDKFADKIEKGAKKRTISTVGKSAEDLARLRGLSKKSSKARGKVVKRRLDKKFAAEQAELSGQANAAAQDAGDQSLDMEKIKDDDDKDDAVGEQVMAPRGSTLDKMDARAGLKGTTPSGPIAGTAPDRAAKLAAFEKQKAVWAAQAKAKAAALPPQVARQRRPVAPTQAPVRTTPGAQTLK
jgi:hypothetical protein